MGTYKVIQDIEAEDKLLGPFSLRQFIYLIIVIVSLFVGFKLMTAPGPAKYFTVLLVPHTAFFILLALPFGHDQSSEVWLLAKIRFFFKPRKRIWDQSGLKELVTITAPKKIEKHLTKEFSQSEVQSRLKALANTIDTRGWAIKNVNENPFNHQYAFADNSQRLIDPVSMPQEVPIINTNEIYDVLDAENNPTAQHMNQLVYQADEQHRQKIGQMMQQQYAQAGTQPSPSSGSQPQQQWFTGNSNIVQPTGESTEKPISSKAKIKTHSGKSPSEQKIKPVQKAQIKTVNKTNSPSVTRTNDPGIINLASNDDLNITTIARQADKIVEEHGNNEVIVSLH